MNLVSILKKIRPFAVLTIVVLTIAAFVYYFHAHPDYIDKLLATSPMVIVLLTITNFALITMVAVINHASAQICQVELEKRESFLLTAYSSLANFFGPLQSGPGVRAGYLKARYKVRLRDFTMVTLIGYGFYAIVSALFLVIGVMPWWASVLVVLGTSGVSYAVIRWFGKKNTKGPSRIRLSPRRLSIIGIATIAQVTLMAVRYGIELTAIGAHASIGQIVSYTGAANFSLFVSITPDGIGIRETFLLFAQRLHGVATNEIVSASLIDRASYVVFLAILGIIALSLHAHKRFATKSKADSENKEKLLD
jgi:uncharacterized membrane protein YbhN (UPF0104 family)